MKGLLLDFGGVVLRTPFELDVPWRGPFAPETDELWRAFQTGDIDERAYWARRAAEAGHADTRALMNVVYAGPESEIVRPEITALVRDAKDAGITVSVLSNELRMFHGREWMARLEILSLVDAIVDASDTKILKPDPRAYRLALDAMGLAAEQVLFVDDQPKNIAGARAVGLGCELFDVTDATASVARCRARLGL